MPDEQRQRKVTRTAVMLGVAALLIYVGYIVLVMIAGEGGGAGG